MKTRKAQAAIEYAALMVLTAVILVSVVIPLFNTEKTMLTNAIKAINQVSNLSTSQINTAVSTNGIGSTTLTSQNPLTANTVNSSAGAVK